MSALRQSSDSPTTKTWAAVIAGAITTILVWATRQWGKVEIPAEIAMAVQVIVGFAASYLTPPGENDTIREVANGPMAVEPPKSGGNNG